MEMTACALMVTMSNADVLLYCT